jgi:5-deoxy-glucuronate isomerase
MSRNDLMIHSRPLANEGETIRVSRGIAGFEYLSLYVQRLSAGGVFRTATGDEELGLVVLGGECEVRSSHGSWKLGGRRNVFDGLPFTLYLPRNVKLSVDAITPCELAFCGCRAEKDFPAQLIRPEDVEIELRGAQTQRAQSITW